MNDDSRVKLIPVDRIRIVNPRVREKKKFEDIVQSISTVGLKKPITVTEADPAPDGAECFDLVCGQGRLEAYLALGQKEIPALVRGLSKPDGMLASLIENNSQTPGFLTGVKPRQQRPGEKAFWSWSNAQHSTLNAQRSSAASSDSGLLQL